MTSRLLPQGEGEYENTITDTGKNSPTLSEWIAAMISIAMEVTENMAEREQTGTQDRALGNTGSRERWLGFK